MKNKQFIKYYKKNFKTLDEAAKKFGKCRATIFLWVHGKANPHYKNIKKIERITKNQVTAASWFA